MLLVVLLHALFGFTFTLGKMVVAYAHPLFAVGVRMLAGGIILGLYTLVSKKIRCFPKRADFALYLQMTVFVILIPYTFRLWALQYVTTTKASLLFSTGPFFTALFSYFITKERLSLVQILGLFIGFMGMVIMLLTSNPQEAALSSWWIISLPEAIVICAIASLSYGLIVTQKLIKHRGCPAPLANGISMLAGGTVALSLSALSPEPSLRGNLTSLIIVLALQVLVSNLFCSNLQAWLLKRYSPTFMSFSGFLGPLFTSIYGYAFFGETVSWHFFASFALVVVGLGLYLFKREKISSTV